MLTSGHLVHHFSIVLRFVGASWGRRLMAGIFSPRRRGKARQPLPARAGAAARRGMALSGLRRINGGGGSADPQECLNGPAAPRAPAYCLLLRSPAVVG